MNEFLLCSSILAGILILLIIYNRYRQRYSALYVFICLGIITSLLNHGEQSDHYKYIDRTVIVANVFVVMYFILQKQEGQSSKNEKLAILFFACFLYLFSKLFDNSFLRDWMHSFAHFVSVILLYIMLNSRNMK